MSNTLIIGKFYNLKFYDSCEFVNEKKYLESVEKLFDTYKLISEGMIPWPEEEEKNEDENIKHYKSKLSKFYIFKNSKYNLIEVFIDKYNKYSSLVIYNQSKFTTVKYSEYKAYGRLYFPNFTGSKHINVDIELAEDQEW